MKIGTRSAATIFFTDHSSSDSIFPMTRLSLSLLVEPRSKSFNVTELHLWPTRSTDCEDLLSCYFPSSTDYTMKIAALLSFLATASAFAPSSVQKSRSTELNAWKDETVVGITAPVGFFDPLGLSYGKSDEVMAYYREAELKHGRVAM